MGYINFYPRFKNQRDWNNCIIKRSQLAYINKLFNKFYLNKVYTVVIPIKENPIFQAKTKNEAFSTEQKRYQGIIDSIILLIVEIKPQVVFATSVASDFAKNLGY